MEGEYVVMLGKHVIHTFNALHYSSKYLISNEALEGF